MAITTTAHKLAHIIYVMLKQRKPYQASAPIAYDHQDQAWALRHLKRKAAQFGLQLLLIESAIREAPAPNPVVA